MISSLSFGLYSCVLIFICFISGCDIVTIRGLWAPLKSLDRQRLTTMEMSQFKQDNKPSMGLSTFISKPLILEIYTLKIILTPTVRNCRTGLDDRHLLEQLPFTEQALFNFSGKQHEDTCLDGTRVDILHQI